jgi:hypothetical protein
MFYCSEQFCVGILIYGQRESILSEFLLEIVQNPCSGGKKLVKILEDVELFSFCPPSQENQNPVLRIQTALIRIRLRLFDNDPDP